MQIKNIKQIFENFNNKKVLIVGDVMIDSYLLGNVNRISPEAPVPVLAVSNRENRLGGAANVALNIKSLGASPIICTVVGNDNYGKIFAELLKKRQISDEGIIYSNNRNTTIKTRVIANAQHLLRIDDENTSTLSPEETKSLIEKIKQIVKTKKIDVIIFEDYDKGVLSENIIKDIVNFANDNNIITTVDPKKENFTYYNNVTMFKPNLKELIEGLKIDINKNNLDEIFEAVEILRKKLNSEIVFSTLSEKGCYIKDNTQAYYHPAEIRQIADVSGAGDTVISVASLLLSENVNINEVAYISNLAGGLVCEKVGVVPVNKEQLLSEIIEKNN